MSNYGPFDESEFYEDINDIARGEGFMIDDDGHWVPLERDEDEDAFGYEDDDIDFDPGDYL